MRIIDASFDVLPRDERRGGLKIIEQAGRLCYRSDLRPAAPAAGGGLRAGTAVVHGAPPADADAPDKAADGSAGAFVRGLIRRRHLSVLEHGDMIFEISDRHIYENVAEDLQILRDSGQDASMLAMSRIQGRYIVSGNIRAWLECFAAGALAGRYFIGRFDPVFVQGMGFCDDDAPPDPRVRQIRYAGLRDPREKRAHLRQTVKFTVDRGVTHEFVRHRALSFSQESTRYCNYSDGRFGREITVIKPCYLAEESEAYGLWKRQCMSAEAAYFDLLNFGLAPQEARAVLPHSTKAELMMTGSLGAWDHFFDLRARQITGKAHPQAAEVAVPLYMRFKAAFPDVFD